MDMDFVIKGDKTNFVIWGGVGEGLELRGNSCLGALKARDPVFFFFFKWWELGERRRNINNFCTNILKKL